ncbi:hypothetical protein EAI30_21335, partial [Romboutsia ilealis]|nr:hypothetical protein [Romboutsia ilealis]
FRILSLRDLMERTATPHETTVKTASKGTRMITMLVLSFAEMDLLFWVLRFLLFFIIGFLRFPGYMSLLMPSQLVARLNWLSGHSGHRL